MKKTFTILIAAIAAILLITQPVKVLGQTKGYTELFSIKSADVVSGTTYKAHTATVDDRGYVITFGGNNASVGTNNNTNNISKCNLNSYSKYAVSPLTTSVHASAFACTSSISNVSKITYTYSGGNNNTNTQVYLIYSSDNSTFSQVSLDNGTQGADICSTNGTYTYEFSPKTGYFALVFKQKNNSNSNAWRIDAVEIKFYKTTYNITYNKNEATGGSVPSATTHDAGSNAIVADNTGSLERTGFNFDGWNTQANGGGTDYAVGATISSIAQDYTLYAKWTSASSPNIVVSGEGISSNTLNLAYTASGDKTATASFNYMTGYSSPTVTLHNNLACTESFSGNWFSASLSGSTITYNASANAGAARTVYMRVTASYNSTTYYSNVITVNQAALPCTVTYNKNNEGASGEMEDANSPYAYGSTVTVLDNAFTAPTGKVFFKWNTASDGTGTYYVKDNTFNITDNTTLYAIWNDIPTYTKITSVSQIIPGAHYIIVGTKADGTKANAMAAQNGNYRNIVGVTIQAKDTDDDGEDDTYYLQQAGLYEFVISGYTDNFTIYDEINAAKGYLYHVGDKNVNVRASIGNDNAAKWKLSFSDDAIVINNVGSTGYYLQYNSSSPRFTDYTSSSNQRNGYLFIKDNDADCNIYSATTLSKNESYTNLTIVKNTNVNGSITVPNEKSLTVTGDLTNGTAANLVIEDGGQLVLNNTNDNVKATFIKNITSAAKDNDIWYTISTPIGGINITDVTNLVDNEGHTLKYNLYRYNESLQSNQWEAYNPTNHDDFTTLVKGKGYLYRNNGKSLSFAGEVNVGNVTGITLTSTAASGDLRGFNLIGNPFGHTIYKGEGAAIDNTSLNEGFYYLTETGEWIAGDYKTPITPRMGILVQVSSSIASLNLTISDTDDKASSESKYANDNLQFMVSNNDYEDVAYAIFRKGEGLNKINHRNAKAPMIYIPQENEDYAIAMMSDDTKMFGLNFKAATMGQYTLSYKAEGNFDYLHVIDRLTGADVDMLIEGNYTFVATPNDNENRFIVQLAYKPDYSEGNDEIFAFQNGDEILVSGEGELQIFDVTGRSVMTTKISGAESINLSAQGVYIFRLIGSEIKTQKIVVR